MGIHLNVKPRLQEFIKDSSLTDKQKEVWGKFIEATNDQTVNTIIKTLEDDPNAIEELTNHLGEELKNIKP